MSGTHLRLGGLGVLMGFLLSRIGFSDFGEVHRMFTFADLRMLLTFATAVVVTALVLAWLRAGRDATDIPLHRSQLLGGALFGAGWALTGACPSIALVQLGEGRAPALITIAGIVIGTAAYGRLEARFGWRRVEACGA